MHADLVVLGYDGSYERVAALLRAWEADRQREEQTSGRDTFVPLVFAAGEAFLFSIQVQQAQASHSPYTCKLHATRSHIKVPAQKLADGTDLVIVTAMRKARDLGPKIFKPRCSLRQPNMTSLDAG